MPNFLTFMDHWDSESDESDYGYDELVDHAAGAAADLEKKWVYLCHSNRGGHLFGDLPTRRVPESDFNLLYNPTDKMLLEKARAEINQSL